MKLSQIKGEKALDIVTELIDPITLIIADEKLIEMYKSDKPKILLIKQLVANHKKEIVKILALLNEKDPETYEPSLIELPMMLLDLINDTELIDLFHYAEQTMGSESSGSAWENIEASEEI